MRPRPTGPLLALLLASATPPVSAQAIYRSVQPGKPLSLQTAPCRTSVKTTSIRPYVPERGESDAELAMRRQRIDAEMAARRRAQAQ